MAHTQEQRIGSSVNLKTACSAPFQLDKAPGGKGTLGAPWQDTPSAELVESTGAEGSPYV